MGFFVRTIQRFEWIFKLEFLKLLSSKWIIMHSTQLECINYSLACWFFQFGLSCDSSEPWMLFPLSRFFPLSLAISLFCPTFEPSYSIYLSVLPPDPHSSSLSPCQPTPSSPRPPYFSFSHSFPLSLPCPASLLLFFCFFTPSITLPSMLIQIAWLGRTLQFQ